MKLKNLKMCHIYSSVPTKKDGETLKKWQYKTSLKLNCQQDINELDVNSAGLIDYDKIKLRIDYDVPINKNDGISFKKIDIDENGYVTEPPKYIVIAKPKIGKTTTFTCEIYHGE